MRAFWRDGLALIASLMLAGCANIGPPQPPSLDLPKPPLDLQAVRKGDRVVLTWTVPTKTTDRQTIRNFGVTRVCRGMDAELLKCDAVGEALVKPGTAATKSKHKGDGTYSDLLSSPIESDHPGSFATYAVEVRDPEGRSAGLSNQVRVPLLRSPGTPQDFQASVKKEGVALSWSGKPNSDDAALRFVYRVYRAPQEGTWTVLTEVPASGESGFSLMDSNLEWEKTYRYRVVQVALFVRDGKQVEVEGDDSAEAKVFADDVFPPAVPSGVQAVFSGPGQAAFIDLIWTPVTDVDLNGYNVYRRDEGTVPVKINGELVKTPVYRDVGVVSGKRYSYSVSAVDLRGNESARSEEAGEQVP